MILYTHVERVAGAGRAAISACSRAAGFGDSADDDGFGRTRAERGQSEIIAVVLLVGVVVLFAGLLIVYGVAAVDSRQGTVADNQAERAFEQFDTRASRVALGGESVQQIDFGLVDNEGHLYSDDNGWIRVVVTPEGGSPVEVTNTTLGTVYYKRDDTVVASQGGGVWRADGEGVVMLSRPEFHYNDQTLTLPIVAVDGPTGLADRVQVTKNGPVDRVFPDPANGLTNKIRSGTVNVTVQSAFYEAWGRYLEENVGGLVTYDHPAETVTVTFFGLPDISGFDVGIIATSDTGKLSIEGTGAYVDSYDSSQGPYSVTRKSDGSIRSAGDVYMTGNARIEGDVAAGGSIEVVNDSSAVLNGSAAWTVGPPPNETRVTGEIRRIDGVPSVPAIDSFVNAYVAQLEKTSDNDDTPLITSNSLDTSSSTVELGAGDYYLHTLRLDGKPSEPKTLILNTTEGDIRIAVRDWVELDHGTIKVVGNGSVQMAVQSQSTVRVNPTGLGNMDVNFHVGTGSNVLVPDQDSDRFVLFGPSHFASTITGSSARSSVFTGIVFAPGGTTGSGYVYVMHSDVYGLVMTGNLTAGQYGAIHYDRGVRSDVGTGSPLAELDYLHAAIHRVLVTSR